MIWLRHTFKDSDLIVRCMLGSGSFQHSLGYHDVQPRLRITDLDMKLVVGNPWKPDFGIRLEYYNAMWYQTRIKKEVCSFCNILFQGEPFVLFSQESGGEYCGPVQRSGERIEQVIMKTTEQRHMESGFKKNKEKWRRRGRTRRRRKEEKEGGGGGGEEELAEQFPALCAQLSLSPSQQDSKCALSRPAWGLSRRADSKQMAGRRGWCQETPCHPYPRQFLMAGKQCQKSFEIVTSGFDQN